MTPQELVDTYRRNAARIRALDVTAFGLATSPRLREAYAWRTRELSEATRSLGAMGLAKVATLLERQRRLLNDARDNQGTYDDVAKAQRRTARALDREIRELLADTDGT